MLLALLPACPLNPTISALGLACSLETDPCPSGFSCVSSVCVAGGTSGGATGGGSNGGTSGGTTGAECNLPDGGLLRPAGSGVSLTACSVDADCQCGLGCFADPAAQVWQGVSSLCEQTPCKSTDGCTNPHTVCSGAGPDSEGHCVVNVCGIAWPTPDSGVNGAFNRSCNSSTDGGDGTCLEIQGQLGACTGPADCPTDFTCTPISQQGSVCVADLDIGLCDQAGSSDAGCGGASRLPLSQLCAAEALCNSGGCTPLCVALADGGSSPACPLGQACVSEGLFSICATPCTPLDGGGSSPPCPFAQGCVPSFSGTTYCL